MPREVIEDLSIYKVLLPFILIFQTYPISIAADAIFSESILLLAVHSEGVETVEAIHFTNLSTKKHIRVNVRARKRQKYQLIDVEPGNYFLSRINFSAMNIAPFHFAEPAALITIESGKISYIGDIILETDITRTGRLTVSYSYETRADTLSEAAQNEPSLFSALDLVISTAGNEPIPVDPALLGL